MTQITREALVAQINEAEVILSRCRGQLEEFDSLAINNRFESLELAENKLYGILEDKAHEDCEGAHNYGDDLYTRQFMVGEDVYEAQLKCEYDRHAKTYYYLDSAQFSVIKLPKAE